MEESENRFSYILMKQLRVITFSIISHQLVHSPRHKLQPSS